MKKTALAKTIARHQHWLNENCTGWRNMRADLSWEDLSWVELNGANLSWVNLHGAKLPNAKLHGADLDGAELYGADLRDADLAGADLRNANLAHADLSRANLAGADLSGANLSNTKLRGTDLSHADLRDANLADAVLGMDTALDEVRYNEATAFFKPCCPEEGSFVAFKKAYMYNNVGKVIVKLQVPDKALRSSATTRKCRVSEAKVISITSLDGKKSLKKARAGHEPTFVYEVGKTVKVKNFDTCRWHECAPGIHCFLTREEAVNY